MKKPKLLFFIMLYKNLTIALYEEDNHSYKTKLASSMASELYRGFKVEKIYSAQKGGTKVKYKKMPESESDYEKVFDLEMAKIRKYIGGINND